MELYFKSRFSLFPRKNIPPDIYSPAFLPETFTTTSPISEGLLKMFGKSTVKFNTQTKNGQWDAYKNCSILQTIIDKRASYLSNRITSIVDEKDVEVKSSQANEILKLINNPNPLQSGHEFDKVCSIYCDVFGFAPIYKVYPAQRTKGVPTALWIIDPSTFTYELTGKLYGQKELKGIIKWIKFTNPGGATVTLEGDQVNNIILVNSKTIRKEDLYTGESPLLPLNDSINNFQIGLNVYGSLLEQSILGIISSRDKDAAGSTPPIKDKEEENIKSKLRFSYGITRDRDNYIITNRSLFFQSLLTNVGNLQIPQALTISVNNICDKLGFSPELLAEKVGTYENKASAEKGQYQNEIIPFANYIAEILTETLDLQGMRIVKTFDHLSVLQKDMKSQADTFAVISKAIIDLKAAGLIDEAQAKEIIQNNMI